MVPQTVGRDPHKDRFVSCECIGKKKLEVIGRGSCDVGVTTPKGIERKRIEMIRPGRRGGHDPEAH